MMTAWLRTLTCLKPFFDSSARGTSEVLPEMTPLMSTPSTVVAPAGPVPLAGPAPGAGAEGSAAAGAAVATGAAAGAEAGAAAEAGGAGASDAAAGVLGGLIVEVSID